MDIQELIVNKIRKDGPITFRDFMEMALYYPEMGYYTSHGQKIGRSGDYFTSAYVTRLFGILIAKQIREMWQLMGCGSFTVVEYGAGTGVLCRHILESLKENEQLYSLLDYYIVERSESMREIERDVVPDKVRWADDISEITQVTGCVLSNELVDNFPVHRVQMAEQLMEIWVDFQDGFREILRPAPPALTGYLEEMKVALPYGVCAEIDLEATNWIKKMAGALQRGFVMTIDYGFPAAALFARRTGTLACYKQHRVSFCPYDHIGKQDITHHVNFSALEHWGRAQGLECCGFTTQSHFLRGLGIAQHLRQLEINLSQNPDRQQQATHFDQLYTLLVEMGRRFMVLIQSKAMDRVFLSGTQFSLPL